MSRLDNTKRAYDAIAKLLDQEIRNRTRPAKDLQRLREVLDVAFYLLGWAQFEYLVRKESEELIKEKLRSKNVDRHAWKFVSDRGASVPVRLRLDLIFHGKPAALAALNKDYQIRNEAAHNNKLLPPEAKDLSAWIQNLEDTVSKFNLFS